MVSVDLLDLLSVDLFDQIVVGRTKLEDASILEATKLTRGDAALALARAVENGTGEVDIIITALTLVLGREGIAAYDDDAARITEAGRLLLLVLLIERDGKSITSLATAIGLEVATIH